MAKFRRKPEIVEAVENPERRVWIVKHSTGNSEEISEALFLQLYERVSDNYRVAPLALAEDL